LSHLIFLRLQRRHFRASLADDLICPCRSRSGTYGKLHRHLKIVHGTQVGARKKTSRETAVCSEGDRTEFGAYEMDNELFCRRWRREVAKAAVTEPEDFHGVSLIPNVRTAPLATFTLGRTLISIHSRQEQREIVTCAEAQSGRSGSAPGSARSAKPKCCLEGFC
jgi:hypothetical protein